MAISSITAYKGITSAGQTGGTAATFSQTVPGEFVNLAAPLTAPEKLFIKSTILPPGKESSYVIQYEAFKDISTAAVGDYKSSRFQAYTVYRFDHEAWSDTEVISVARMLGILNTDLGNSGLVAGVLRGNK